MKKIFLFLLTFVFCILSFTSCSKTTKTEENKVYVYNWGDDIDPDVLKSFEEETGIKVIYDEYDTNEDMYAKIQSGAVEYDVLNPSAYMIERLIKENKIQPLDFSKIPNIKNIDKNDMERVSKFDEGKYAVPYGWDIIGIVYNKKLVSEKIDSWGFLFDDAILEKYNNNFVMIDSMRDAFMCALKYKGYSTNTTDEKELNEAKELLKKQQKYAKAYSIDGTKEMMIGENAAFAVNYSSDSNVMISQNPDLEFVYPKEGSALTYDAFVIPSNAKNVENAHKFIDYMCRPDIALKNFNVTNFPTPNVEAQKMLPEEIRNNKTVYPDDSITSKCETYNYQPQNMIDLYNNMWKEIRGN